MTKTRKLLWIAGVVVLFLAVIPGQDIKAKITDVVKSFGHSKVDETFDNRMIKAANDLKDGKITKEQFTEQLHSAEIVSASDHNSVENLPKPCPDQETLWTNGRKTLDISGCHQGTAFWLALDGPGNYHARFGSRLENGSLKGELLDEPRIEASPFPSAYGPNVAKKVGPKTYELFGDTRYIHEGLGNVLELTKR